MLAPWPNRLADGRYEFNGVRAQAALDEPERHNAIHGLVRWLPWTLQTRHQNQLSLRLQLHPSPGYPFSLLLEIEYHVGREGLTVTTRASSLDDGIIPFGLGFHPYLTAGPETVDGAILHVPARHTLDVDDRGLPTGALTPVEGTDRDFTAARFVGPAVLDTGYTTLERDADGLAWASLDAPGGATGAALWVDEGFPYLMVYTGDTLGEIQRRRRAVAIEPMTCPPNALRTGKDVIDLQPDQEWSAPLGHRATVSARAWARASRGAARSWPSPARRAGSARPRRAPSPPRVPRSSSTRPARSPRARRSPPRCPTRTTCRATSPSRGRPSAWWPPPSSGGDASTCS